MTPRPTTISFQFRRLTIFVTPLGYGNLYNIEVVPRSPKSPYRNFRCLAEGMLYHLDYYFLSRAEYVSKSLLYACKRDFYDCIKSSLSEHLNQL